MTGTIITELEKLYRPFVITDDDRTHNRAVAEAIETFKKYDPDGWIKCSDRFPENEKEVEVTIEKHLEDKVYKFTCRAMHEDGTMHTEDSGYSWEDHDFVYCDDTDDYIIPEGWYEQNTYCDEFGIVDDFVIAWKPLTQPYKESEEEE